MVTCRQKRMIKGIRYQYQGVSFSGTELGADYTWKKVNKGVNSIKAIPSEYLSYPRTDQSEDLEEEKKKKDEVLQKVRLHHLAPVQELMQTKVSQSVSRPRSRSGRSR